MGVWVFTAGLVLIVVILNNVQHLEAVLKGDSSTGKPVSTEEMEKALEEFNDCTVKWRARIGDPCFPQNEIFQKYGDLTKKHGKDIMKLPRMELKALYERHCLDSIQCSVSGKCECIVGSAICVPSDIPKKDLKQNCEALGTRTDPAQNSQYIILLALIFFFVVAN